MHRALNAPRNSVPSSTQIFRLFMLDHLFEGLCCLVAYFVFSDSTLRYLDKQSTATSRYFTPQFYFVNLSTYARSTSQISFIALTTTLSLGNPRRRERYLVKDGFVYRYIFFIDILLKFCSLFALSNDGGPFKFSLSSFHTSSKKSQSFLRIFSAVFSLLPSLLFALHFFLLVQIVFFLVNFFFVFLLRLF